MTKGQGARRERLRPEMLSSLKLRMPPLEQQRSAIKIIRSAQQILASTSSRKRDLESLVPAMLNEIFNSKQYTKTSSDRTEKVISLPFKDTSEIDAPFREAVLVGSIVKAFHQDDGQPLGNFRLQKAVYFARRRMGEKALNKDYLRKAAGPYNPQMRYSGGIKIASDKKWIKRATGKYGSGSALGSSAAEMDEWTERYHFSPITAWVRDRFKYKSNEIWETLATIDYAKLVLEQDNVQATASEILAYIANDEEWRPKIPKLRLTEASIQNAMVELETLFSDITT